MTLEQLRELYRQWAPACFVALAFVLISAAVILAEDFVVFAAVVLAMSHHVVRVSEALIQRAIDAQLLIFGGCVLVGIAAIVAFAVIGARGD